MPTCRFCGTDLTRTFVDLGVSPVANDYLSADALDRMEPFYPLHARVCDKCLLVQLPPVQDPQSFFNDRYAYFSSFSDSWLAHARDYAAAMIRRFGLGPAHRVVEVASNDGYLLQYFREAGIPVIPVAGLDDLLAFVGESAELASQRDRLLEYRARYGIGAARD